MDINFGKNWDNIESSRILFVVNNGYDENVQSTLRKIVKNSGIPGVQVFNYAGNVIEQVTPLFCVKVNFVIVYINIYLIQ